MSADFSRLSPLRHSSSHDNRLSIASRRSPIPSCSSSRETGNGKFFSCVLFMEARFVVCFEQFRKYDLPLELPR